MSFEEKYRQQMNEVSFNKNFEKETVELLKSAAERKEKRVMKKPVKILVAAVLAVAVLSVTAFAISELLSARDVAEKLGENYVAESFDRQDFTPETVTDKGYTVSFLGVVKGGRFEAENIKADCSYFVVSVASADGSALSLVDGNPLGMSVIIEGYPAWKINTWSLNTNATGTEENGVLYYLYECENLEIFADKNVYLAVYEGFVPGLDIINMKENGEFEFVKTYSGFKAMFKLPLDPSKADPEAANELLKEYFEDENAHLEYKDEAVKIADGKQIISEEYGFIERSEDNEKGEYIIDYLGRKSGTEIGVTEDEEYEFYVYSVRKSDGTPLTITDVPLEIQPVIKGCPVWAVNGYKLNISGSIKEENGALLYMFHCDDLDLFADRDVYLFALESGAPYLEIIELQNDGTFVILDEYEGWGTIFEMQLDKANADKEKADKIISQLMPKASEKWSITK